MTEFRFILATFAFMTLVKTAAFASEPQMGNCNGGNCSWSVTINKTVLEKQKTGVLYRIELIGGTSEHKDGEYPDRYSKNVNVEWNKESHKVEVYCSTKLPLLVMDDQVTLLDLHNVPGVFVADANLWFGVCYEADAGVWMSEDFLRKHQIPTTAVKELTPRMEADLLKWVRSY
jgi:hypothetical protein